MRVFSILGRYSGVHWRVRGYLVAGFPGAVVAALIGLAVYPLMKT